MRGSITGARARAGFTLIELLIALSVLSFILAVATAGYGRFLDLWRTAGDRLDSHAERVRLGSLLQQTVEGAWDYYTVNPEGANQPYFEGGADGFRFVTARPFFVEQELAVAQLRLVSEGNAAYRLRYSEWSLDRDILRTWADRAQRPARQVEWPLAIQRYTIRYYGYDRRERSEMPSTTPTGEFQIEPLSARWHDTYFGRQTGYLPSAIRVRLSGPDGENLSRDFRIRTWNPRRKPSGGSGFGPGGM